MVRRRAIAGLLGLALSILVPATSASASSPPPPPSPSAGSSVAVPAPVQLDGRTAPHVYSQAESAQLNRQGGDPAVLNFWTPQRMATATPLDVGVSSAVANRSPAASATRPLQIGSRPTGPIASRTPSGASTPLTPAPITNFPPINGKLFFVEGGTNLSFVCSASAINSPSKREIITAAHCAHTGKGGSFSSNVMFAPGYDGRSTPSDPYGKFQASTLRVSTEWVTYGGKDLTTDTEPGYARDVAFVTLYAGGNNNKNVVDAVGGHGFSYNGPYEFDASVFGYPMNNANGQVMVGCYGTTMQDSNFTNRSLLGCNFDGGASGGPWLDQYDNSTGIGYVHGVTSTGTPPPSPSVNGAAHFDDATNTMFVMSQTDG